MHKTSHLFFLLSCITSGHRYNLNVPSLCYQPEVKWIARCDYCSLGYCIDCITRFSSNVTPCGCWCEGTRYWLFLVAEMRLGKLCDAGDIGGGDGGVEFIGDTWLESGESTVLSGGAVPVRDLFGRLVLWEATWRLRHHCLRRAAHLRALTSLATHPLCLSLSPPLDRFELRPPCSTALRLLLWCLLFWSLLPSERYVWISHWISAYSTVFPIQIGVNCHIIREVE